MERKSDHFVSASVLATTIWLDALGLGGSREAHGAQLDLEELVGPDVPDADVCEGEALRLVGAVADLRLRPGVVLGLRRGERCLSGWEGVLGRIQIVEKFN